MESYIIRPDLEQRAVFRIRHSTSHFLNEIQQRKILQSLFNEGLVWYNASPDLAINED